MTARSYEAIRVGLRGVIRDPRATVTVRMRAIELLLQVEGLMERPKTNGKRDSIASSQPNAQELRDLLQDYEPPPKRDSDEDPWQGLPES